VFAGIYPGITTVFKVLLQALPQVLVGLAVARLRGDLLADSHEFSEHGHKPVVRATGVFVLGDPSVVNAQLRCDKM